MVAWSKPKLVECGLQGICACASKTGADELHAIFPRKTGRYRGRAALQRWRTFRRGDRAEWARGALRYVVVSQEELAMKHIALLAVSLIALAACGGGEPAPTPPVAETPAVETPVTPPPQHRPKR